MEESARSQRGSPGKVLSTYCESLAVGNYGNLDLLAENPTLMVSIVDMVTARIKLEVGASFINSSLNAFTRAGVVGQLHQLDEEVGGDSSFVGDQNIHIEISANDVEDQLAKLGVTVRSVLVDEVQNAPWEACTLGTLVTLNKIDAGVDNIVLKLIDVVTITESPQPELRYEMLKSFLISGYTYIARAPQPNKGPS